MWGSCQPAAQTGSQNRRHHEFFYPIYFKMRRGISLNIFMKDILSSYFLFFLYTFSYKMEFILNSCLTVAWVNGFRYAFISFRKATCLRWVSCKFCWNPMISGGASGDSASRYYPYCYVLNSALFNL